MWRLSHLRLQRRWDSLAYSKTSRSTDLIADRTSNTVPTGIHIISFFNDAELGTGTGTINLCNFFGTFKKPSFKTTKTKIARRIFEKIVQPERSRFREKRTAGRSHPDINIVLFFFRCCMLCDASVICRCLQHQLYSKVWFTSILKPCLTPVRAGDLCYKDNKHSEDCVISSARATSHNEPRSFVTCRVCLFSYIWAREDRRHKRVQK